MEIGKNIKQTRKSKGITQRELGEKIGKGFSTVQKYELGIIAPPIEVVRKISDALEVPIGMLLGHEVARGFSEKNVIEIELLKLRFEKNKLEAKIFNRSIEKIEQQRYCELIIEEGVCERLLKLCEDVK